MLCVGVSGRSQDLIGASDAPIPTMCFVRRDERELIWPNQLMGPDWGDLWATSRASLARLLVLHGGHQATPRRLHRGGNGGASAA